MGGEDSRRRAEAATFAWSTLQKTVREYPVIGVLLAVAVPLLGAAGVFLLPFALPLAIGLFIWSKRGGAKADGEGGADATAGSDASKQTLISEPRTTVTIDKAPPTTKQTAPSAEASASSRSATSSGSGSAPTSTAPPLTGSAALMARMRKSGAVTGEKRSSDPASIAAEAAAKADAAAAKQANAPNGSNGKKDASDESTSFGSDPNSRLFFLYGGEASTQIARDLAEKAAANGLSPKLVAMDDFKRCELDTKPAVAVFVVETIENAQPAEAAGTCLRFHNRQRKAGNSGLLAGKLRYAVLGLGDTNLLLDRQTTTAKDCNQAAQTLDSALHFLGGERMCRRGEANDAVGLEEAVEPWSEKLWAPLSKAVDAIGASTSAPGSSDAPEVKFLFGSQTGNAAEICKEMAAEAPRKGFSNVHCNAMNEVDVKDVLKPGNLIVYVVSSTGDGDAPDNCDSFFTKLKRVAKKEAGTCGVGVQYTVLGLGDQNYSAFMTVPRSFTMAMEKAGAKAFYPRGEADETLGLYEYCENWQENLWEPLRAASERAPALAKDPTGGVVPVEKPATPVEKPATPASAPAAASTESADLVGVPALPACRTAVTWRTDAVTLATYPVGSDSSVPPSGADHFTHEEPYLAKVAKCEVMTNLESDRRVLHVEFDTGGAKGLDFEPGDSVGVLPTNDAATVDALTSRLGLDPAAVFELVWAEGQAPSADCGAPLRHVRCPASVKDALTHAVDVTSQPRKSLLRVLAEACTDAGERRDLLTLCSKGGRDEYKARCGDECPSLLDLLRSHPSCKPGWAELLDALQPLQPRMYSITSAPEAHGGVPAVAFSVVKFATPSGAQREGVATNWLDRGVSAENFRVPLYVKKSTHFKPPTDVSHPVIMIGPGTGVAPFRGFLERRRAMIKAAGVNTPESKPGPAWLFFGCRRADEDYLYRDDLQSFHADGTLTELVTAFSRESHQKVYVQHKIAERAAEVAAVASAKDARVFVCGDGAHMAKDVHAALVDAIANHVDGMDAKQANDMLTAMTKEGRYVRDIWS